MAGVPPAAGFFGKYFLFWQAYERGLLILVIVGFLTSLISMYYYLKIIKLIWFAVPLFASPVLVQMSPVNLSNTGVLNTLILLFLYLFAFITQPALDVVDKLCVSLYYVL